MTEAEIRNIEKAVIKTLAYFDIFDYPLSMIELWNWLLISSPVDYDDLTEVVENSQKLNKLIASQQGMFFLAGRSEIIKNRKDKYANSFKKLNRAKFIAEIYSRLPFVRMAAVCNTLAYQNSRAESDIDFFIVTERNRIWLVRLMTAAIVKLSGLRPNSKTCQDKICLSFFIADQNLSLKDLAINDFDIYLIYWLANVMPIYDQDDAYKKFLSSNCWLKSYLANIMPYQTNPSYKAVLGGRSQKAKKFFEKILKGKFGHKLEILSKKIQWAAFPITIKNLSNQDSRVVINDQMLKFHTNDRRKLYYQQYLLKLKQIIKTSQNG